MARRRGRSAVPRLLALALVALAVGSAAARGASAQQQVAPGTNLATSTTVRSEHNIESTLEKVGTLQRSVNVTDSTNVAVAQPQVSMDLSARRNSHMRLNDTDAFDVGGAASAASLLPANTGAGAGAGAGTARGGFLFVAEQPQPQAQAQPAGGVSASASSNIDAKFNVPSNVASNVTVRDATAVRASSGVRVGGAAVKVRADASDNAQIVASHADLASVGSGGGAAGRGAGGGGGGGEEAKAAEAPAPAGGEGEQAPASEPASASDAINAAVTAAAAPVLGGLFSIFQQPPPAAASPASRKLLRAAQQGGADAVRTSAAVVETSAPAEGDAGMDLQLTMNITHSVDVDVSRNVTEAHDVELTAQNVSVSVGAAGNKQLSANGSRVFNVDFSAKCGPASGEGGAGGGAGEPGAKKLSARGVFKIIFNIVNAVRVDARQSVAQSRNVMLRGAPVDVRVSVANNTQIAADRASIANVIAQAGCGGRGGAGGGGGGAPGTPLLPLPISSGELASLAETLHGLAARFAKDAEGAAKGAEAAARGAAEGAAKDAAAQAVHA